MRFPFAVAALAPALVGMLVLAPIASTFLASPAVAAEAEAIAQVHSLETMCSDSAEARAGRHAETSLYERLGKSPGIHALTIEVMRLHAENPAISHYVEGLDSDKVAHRVAAFIISNTGGPSVYEGPDLTTSHADMKLSNADFMAAGGDVMQAMQNLEYGQEEIDEMVCALVSLRAMVVLAK